MFGRAGAALVGFLLSNFRLRSDARREGQDAFTASPFSRLALTQMLSLGGDALVTVALAGSLFFNISVTAARGRVALSLVLTIAPFAIVAPFLGPIIDRLKGGRRAMIVASSIGRIAACLFMARYIHGLLLFPAAFLSLVSSKAYTVAKAAIVPAVVEHNDDLVEANSKLAVGGAIAGFLAFVPGVPILKLFGAAALLRVDSVVYLLCAISALRLIQTPTTRIARPDPAPDTGGMSRFKARTDLPPGALTAATVAMATLRFTVGFLVFLVAFAFRRTHAPAWWYGVILAASVGGNLIGATIAPHLRGRVREEYIVAGSLTAVVVAGVLLVPVDVFQRRPAACILAAVIGIAAGAGKLAFDSLVQQEVPAAAQGKVFGRLEAMFQLVWVLGALVPVLVALSLDDGTLIVAVVSAAALVIFLTGLRMARHDHLPAWWPGIGHRPAATTTALGGAVGAPVVDAAPPGPPPVPYWPEPAAPMVSGGGVLGGPVVGPEDSTGHAVGSAGPVFPAPPDSEWQRPPDGSAQATIANGPATNPNLARPPRLRPPPLSEPPLPFDAGALPDPPE
ncbi:MAG TPA: MFS transporter [Acidimicrobiales bacterium]